MAAVLVDTRPQADVAKSKYAFILDHRPAALAARQSGPAHFGDENPLHKELRTVYDWMAEARGADRMSSRQFKQRLPEIHKKFPELARSFSDMDYNSDGWLTWEEFVEFCLSDKKMETMLNRARAVTVYGVDGSGKRSCKDFRDPVHMCETGVAPPLLPWEVAHVVEWRITGLAVSRKGAPCMYAGVPIRPGTSIASPPFRAGGVCGSLRLWPAGYYSEPQRRTKATLPPCADDLAAGAFDGGLRPVKAPSHNSWCCLAVCGLPHGTRLQLRFFVGSARSEKRDCCWREGVHATQLWAPPETAPPESLGPDAPLIVGVEILRKVDGSHWGKRPKTTMTHPLRLCQRPAIPDSSLLGGSVLLGRAQEVQPQRVSRSRSLPQLAYGRPSTSNL